MIKDELRMLNNTGGIYFLKIYTPLHGVFLHVAILNIQKKYLHIKMNIANNICYSCFSFSILVFCDIHVVLLFFSLTKYPNCDIKSCCDIRRRSHKMGPTCGYYVCLRHCTNAVAIESPHSEDRPLQ